MSAPRALCTSRAPHAAHDWVRTGELVGGELAWCPGLVRVTMEEVQPHAAAHELGRVESELGVTFSSPAWRAFALGVLYSAGPRRLAEITHDDDELAFVRTMLAAECGA